jgi:hypothetical protein
MNQRSHLIALFVVNVAVACDKPKEPAAAERPSAPASAPAVAPAPAAASRSIKWVDPPRWKKVGTGGPMRKASYQVPGASAGTEPGELAVFHFGKDQGGSIEANVERWSKQFPSVDPSKVRRSQRNAKGMVQHIVEIEEGTFTSNMPGSPSTPKPAWALLGAIVEGPDGNWFFKLTGPRATVSGAKSEFFTMLDSTEPTGG